MARADKYSERRLSSPQTVKNSLHKIPVDQELIFS